MEKIFLVPGFFTLVCLLYCYKIPMKTTTWGLGLLGGCFYGPLFLVNLIGILFCPQNLAFFQYAVLFFLAAHILFVYSFFKVKGPFDWVSIFFAVPAFYARANQKWKLKSGTALFYQADRAKAPCIVLIFGGGFIGGSVGQLATVPNLLRKKGYHVVCLPYRHLPEAIWPLPLNDLQLGLQQILSKKTDDFNPDSFHLFGRSAGGYLALQLSHLFFQEKRLKSVISLYPISDIQAWTKERGSQSILNSQKIVHDLFRAESPEFQDVSQAPQPFERKFFIVTGDFDPYVDPKQSNHLKQNLENQGHQVENLVLPFQSHGFDVNLHSFAGQVFTKALLQFLKERSSAV